MNITLHHVYKHPPFCVKEGIPIFSQNDDYLINYEKIANDHVSQISQGIINPWIAQETWEEMELSTLNLVQKYIKLIQKENNIKFLDVGVGLGRLFGKMKTSLKHHSIDAYGIDIAMSYLKIAKQNDIKVSLSRIEDMPYKPNMFDIITCTDVLEHVLDLNRCIRKILDVLKPGGILIIRVPYREDLSGYLKKDYPYFMVHLRNFDQYSLELLFSRIFKQIILEFQPGPYVAYSNLLKYKLPVVGYNFSIRNSLKMSKLISKKLHEKIIKILYWPVEINIVIQKPINKKR